MMTCSHQPSSTATSIFGLQWKSVKDKGRSGAHAPVKIGGETARCQQARKGAGTRPSGGGYLWRRQDPGRERAGFIHASRSPQLNASSPDSCLCSRLPLDLLLLLPQNRLPCPRKSPAVIARRQRSAPPPYHRNLTSKSNEPKSSIQTPGAL
jgi:hypothetical protein